ncbi:hypothetical protein V3C99_013625 [Haemonchus contortus]
MNCDDTEKVIHDCWFLTALFGQIIASIVSIVLSILVVLLTAMLYLYIAHSFLIIITLTIHLAYYFFTDPCTLSIPSAVCSGLHFPAVCCMLSFVLLQFFMVVERSVALWKRLHYESYGPKLAVTLVLLSVILPPTTVILAMGGLHSPETHIFCGFADGDSGHNLIGFTWAMCGINLITLIIASFLEQAPLPTKVFRSQFVLSASRRRYDHSYYPPFDIISNYFLCGVFWLYSRFLIIRKAVDKVTYLILNAATYIIPYYTVVSPILMWFTIRWSQQLKQSRLKNIVNQTSNDYFNAQKEMWQ